MGTKRGFPPRDESDVRWKWKQSEIEAMHTLGSSCFEQLMSDEEYVCIDPILVAPQAWVETELVAERYVALHQLFENERPCLHEEVASILGPVEDLDAWNVLQFLCDRADFRESARTSALSNDTKWQPQRGGDLSLRRIMNHHVSLRIRQSWTNISIFLRGKESRSLSLTASILTQETEGVILSYQYRNDPNVDAPAALMPHYGTTRLVLSPDEATLDGDYYSARGRQNIGILHLKRERVASCTWIARTLQRFRRTAKPC